MAPYERWGEQLLSFLTSPDESSSDQSEEIMHKVLILSCSVNPRNDVISTRAKHETCRGERDKNLFVHGESFGLRLRKHEAKCIDIVVKEIHSKLPHTISSEDEPLVGMKCRIEEGTKNIEGILMHPQCELKHTDIAIEAFKDMQKLRLLEVHNVCTPRVPEYLPSQLRWLIWEEFPSKSLPPRFEANNLVGLQLHCSSIERPWRGEKMHQHHR
ncbi:hypothetical protein LguiB_013076 [Lonicera macranthoides]